MTEDQPAIQSLRSHGKRLTLTLQTFGLALHVTVIASQWGHWSSVAILVSLWLAAAVGNVLIAEFVTLRRGHDRGENLRAAYNIVIHAAIGVVCDWSFASWLFVPFLAGMIGSPEGGQSWPRVVALLVALGGIALVTGARWSDAAICIGISMYLHVVIDAYLDFARKLLRERARMFQDLKAAQQGALAQEKLASVGQLAAGIAHEINNPMCFITANTEALLDDLRDEPALSPRLAEYRDGILADTLDGILRVNSIVGDLRRFARGEPEQPVEFDLSAEVLASVRMARTQVASNQELHTELAATSRIVGMPRQISQAVLNLIVNALHALDPRGGHVWVTMVERDDAVVLAVKDDGAGMSSDTQKQLFQPFFTSKPVGKGLGLGLAVVYGIVQAHHGRIDVDSAPGHGTCFTITLPRLRGHAGAAQPEPARAADRLAS